MAFFDNLGKKVGEAAQSVSKKSGELVEITKLNMSINSEEDKIKKKYSEIGKKAYEIFLQDPDSASAFLEECEEISQSQSSIDDLKAKIMQAKNLKKCVGCGAELEKSIVFCSKCGAKNEPIVEIQPEGVVCPSCGVVVSEGSAFCQACGTKVEE